MVEAKDEPWGVKTALRWLLHIIYIHAPRKPAKESEDTNVPLYRIYHKIFRSLKLFKTIMAAYSRQILLMVDRKELSTRWNH
jgi:hypothetical protein